MAWDAGHSMADVPQKSGIQAPWLHVTPGPPARPPASQMAPKQRPDRSKRTIRKTRRGAGAPSSKPRAASPPSTKPRAATKPPKKPTKDDMLKIAFQRAYKGLPCQAWVEQYATEGVPYIWPADRECYRGHPWSNQCKIFLSYLTERYGTPSIATAAGWRWEARTTV